MARPDEYANEFDISAEETPMTEDEIYDTVEQIYATDDRIDPTYIEITVQEGIVYLEGSVSNQAEKEMAESLLDNIEGIQSVVNNLEVVLSDYNDPEVWPGIEEPQEDEFGTVEVLEPDEDLVTEDPQEAIDEGKSYVPPNEPTFPTERGDAAERMRERVAEERSKGRTHEQL